MSDIDRRKQSEDFVICRLVQKEREITIIALDCVAMESKSNNAADDVGSERLHLSIYVVKVLMDMNTEQSIRAPALR